MKPKTILVALLFIVVCLFGFTDLWQLALYNRMYGTNQLGTDGPTRYQQVYSRWTNKFESYESYFVDTELRCCLQTKEKYVEYNSDGSVKSVRLLDTGGPSKSAPPAPGVSLPAEEGVAKEDTPDWFYNEHLFREK